MSSIEDLPPFVLALVVDAFPGTMLGKLALTSKGFRALAAERVPAPAKVKIEMLRTPEELCWASSMLDWSGFVWSGLVYSGRERRKLTRSNSPAAKLACAIVKSGDASVLARAWRASGRRLCLKNVCVVAAETGSVECLHWALSVVVSSADVDPCFAADVFIGACGFETLNGISGVKECVETILGRHWMTKVPRRPSNR